MAIFINSYIPITATQYGIDAMNQFGIHPLEDGSIRREPDFTNERPGISGLCRPRSMTDIGLKPKDIMVYKTNGSHILTAILEIDEHLTNHQEAAIWYRDHNLPVPSNNIIVEPLGLDHSHVKDFEDRVGRNQNLDNAFHREWNRIYEGRANDPNSSYFFITNPIYNAVFDNKQEADFIKLASILRRYFGRIPNTVWRPQPLTEGFYHELLELI